jgi:hypothetical protein
LDKNLIKLKSKRKKLGKSFMWRIINIMRSKSSIVIILRMEEMLIKQKNNKRTELHLHRMYKLKIMNNKRILEKPLQEKVQRNDRMFIFNNFVYYINYF